MKSNGFNSLLFVLTVGFALNTCSSPKRTVPKVYTVEISQMKFQPEVLKIHQKDTVIFINHDIVAHDVTEINKAWKSPVLNTGDSWKIVMQKSANYFCSIHLVMKGKIIVE
ncbi:hypothetical protein Pedsa_3522 [Pseudopedobacter saltans DSM 12145]|uniref:EfeO-type cupredoxin-like domain-containing protein n=1 Tax=Pseudopedobacter saltans (strain ATCC 51119 / DSM 12145 / JCM 21818 / CCUG 39354 / LMG 10337 / NBRC 100064 / NCIMB 13643) TaxID=762903 RepID=F0SEY4_PSESL|nr:cupredoxin domain-containing protein [Pseudopedobacter saltans]ADY54052.1 hypothetical protein Pedsa_3522 [Pseudopedobacter saltans DSM 12145]